MKEISQLCFSGYACSVAGVTAGGRLLCSVVAVSAGNCLPGGLSVNDQLDFWH